MPIKRSANKSSNSKRRKANNRTLEISDTLFLKILEERLFLVGSEVLKNKQTDSRLELAPIYEILEDLELIESKLNNLKTANTGFSLLQIKPRGFDSIQIIRSALKKHLETYKPNARLSKKVRRGPPQISGKLAMVIYSALVAAVGNRNLLNDIGKLISENGMLSKRFDSEYGRGAFYGLTLPSVSPSETRWERSCKSALREYAEKSMFRGRLAQSKSDKDYFKYAVRTAWRTRYDIEDFDP